MHFLQGAKKAVVGSEDGVLSLYSWDNWGDCTDRFPGHPGSIDTMVKYDESTVITGCSDGALRVINILPNKIVSVLADHAIDMPIERIRVSHDGSTLASCSHDARIYFWNLEDVGNGGRGCLSDDDSGEEDGSGDSDEGFEGGDGDGDDWQDDGGSDGPQGVVSVADVTSEGMKTW